MKEVGGWLRPLLKLTHPQTRFMRKTVILCFVVLAFGLSGCVSPCDASRMAVKNIKISNTRLAEGKIQLDEISGERITDPSERANIADANLKKALASSLIAGRIYSGEAGRYLLSVSTADVKSEAGQSDKSVSVEVRLRYEVRTRQKGVLVYKKEIVGHGKAGESDGFLLSQRLRSAKERAVKSNIENFLKALNREFGVSKKARAGIR